LHSFRFKSINGTRRIFSGGDGGGSLRGAGGGEGTIFNLGGVDGTDVRLSLGFGGGGAMAFNFLSRKIRPMKAFRPI
jgi:hypothetical protein